MSLTCFVRGVIASVEVDNDFWLLLVLFSSKAAVTLAQCPLFSFCSTDEQQMCSQIGRALERFGSNFVEV